MPQLNHPGKPGKLPSKPDPRALDFSNYIDLSKLNVPAELDWTIKKTTPWGMMNNWLLSDCTCAAAGHMIECWTANTTKEHIVRNKDIMKAYSALSGYDPVTGKNDIPLYLSDVLKYWRKNGVGTHKIKAYTTINYNNRELLKASTYLFGGTYAGVNLPNTIKGADVWEVTDLKLQGDSAPGTFGGHCINIVAYDDKYVTAISWGKEQKMTWEFWDVYGDDLYAIITEDFFNDNKSPVGFDMAALEASLLNITRAKKALQKQLTTTEHVAGRSGTVGGTSGGKGGTKGKELKVKQAGAVGTKAGVTGKELKAKPAGAAGTRAGAAGKELKAKPAGAGKANAGATGIEKAVAKKKAPAGAGKNNSGAAGKELAGNGGKKSATGTQTKAVPKKKGPAGSAGGSVG